MYNGYCPIHQTLFANIYMLTTTLQCLPLPNNTTHQICAFSQNIFLVEF